MRLDYGYSSHVGLVRGQNEDSFVVGPGILAVCDGMGGAQAGEVASATACGYLAGLDPQEADHVALDRTVRKANDAILQKSVDDKSYAGMGTTMTAVIQTGARDALVAHVGDSRAYVLRGGRLRQLTDDHSMVAEMVRRGQLTPQQAAVHPHRSVITRALGAQVEVEPDLLPLELEEGDRILICSDGLTGMVPDEEIARILREAEDPQTAADALVEAALDAGGEDNVTVVVALAGEVDDAESPPEEIDVVVGPDNRSLEGDQTAGSGPAREKVIASPTIDRGAPGGQVPSVTGPTVPVETGDTSEEGGLVDGWRRWAVIGVVVLAVVVLLAVAGFAAFNSSVYFVGTSDGSVALYNGLPYQFLGVDLYEVVEVTDAQYDDLPRRFQERIDTHELVTKEEGQQFIRSLAARDTDEPTSSAHEQKGRF